MSELSHNELARYGRHLLMPEVGMDGQQKLKQSSALIIGAGGLGSPIGQYLAAAGVGHIGIADFDNIELSNLQRQVLFTTDDIGSPKLDTAIARLKKINPEIQFTPHPGRLTSANALEVLAGYDVIIDGTDNFPTRYLVNDACVLLKKPLVYGSIYRFEGQVSVFDAEKGPCYRCLFPTPPPPDMVPSCAEGGVLGVLPGIIGSLQALEALKLLLGVGEPLIGRLVLFDALRFEFRELKIRKRKDCPICGDEPTIKQLIDYEAFCNVTIEEPMFNKIKTIDVVELNEKLQSDTKPVVIDVRNEHEYVLGNIGAVHVPLSELAEKLNDFDKNAEIVVHCRSGKRSMQAARQLVSAGFKDVTNLTGGLVAWAKEVDSSVKVY